MIQPTSTSYGLCRTKRGETISDRRKFNKTFSRAAVRFLFCSIAVSVIAFNLFAGETSDIGKTVNRAELITGSLLFSSSYLFCVYLACQNDPNTKYLLIPVCGPFLTSKSYGEKAFVSDGFYVACLLCALESSGIICFTAGLPRKRYRHPVELVPTFNRSQTGLKLIIHV